MWSFYQNDCGLAVALNWFGVRMQILQVPKVYKIVLKFNIKIVFMLFAVSNSLNKGLCGLRKLCLSML